jgi:hypothetical protein
VFSHRAPYVAADEPPWALVNASYRYIRDGVLLTSCTTTAASAPAGIAGISALTVERLSRLSSVSTPSALGM